jgi:hypothetical protein
MVYFLSKKAGAAAMFAKYKAEVENQFNLKINRIMVGGGGEYYSEQFSKFLTSRGMINPTYGKAKNGCSMTFIDLR